MAKILLHCKGIFTKTSLFFIGFLLAFSGWAQTEPATVTTDKDDYAPGEYVIITGTGWEPGERVDFTFEETPKPETCVNSHDNFAIADEGGNIYYDQFLIKINHLGVAFVLTATGQVSERIAVTEFTDANVTFSLTGLPSNVSLTGSYRVFITNSEPSGAFTPFSFNYPGPGPTPAIAVDNNQTIQYAFNNVIIGTTTYSALDGSAVGKNDGKGGQTINVAYSAVSCTAPTITSTGTISSVTYSGIAQTTTLPYTATGSSPTSYTIDWNAAANTAGLPDQGSTSHIFSSGAGSMSSIAVPALLPSGTYLGVVTVRNACGLSGTKNLSLTINKAPSVTTVTVQAGTYNYTGLAQTPATVTVTGAGGLSLNPAPIYANNINAGTATASYSYPESANHLASSNSEDFTIGKAASITVVTVPAGPYTYTGLAQTSATVSVTGAGGLNETPTATYLNNINAGTATASYTYTESANHLASSDSEEFIIGKAASVTVVTVPAGPYTYTGLAQTPAMVSVTGAGGLNETPTATYLNNIDAGTATASYTYTESVNHLASSDSEDFTIGKAATTTVVTINGDPFTYTGSAITPATVLITGANLNLEASAVYANNINAGTATASYSYPESANHLASSNSEDFTIGKAASITVVTVPAGPYTYTGLAQTSATVSVTGAGGLNETPTATYLNNINAGTATASYTYTESANHLASSDSEEFIIGKAASVTVVTVPAGPYTYTGLAQTPAMVSVTGAGGLNETPTATYLNNIDAGTATASYTYTESVNHLASSDSEDFTIGKAATTTVVTINGDPFTYTGSAITPATVLITGANLNLEASAVYANNINAGTATASYTYTESANHLASSDSEDFTIGKAATTTVVTINGDPFIYTGSAITPATVLVTGANLSLEPSAVYENNINAGTATASYSYAESANHLASSNSEDFTIGKAASITVVTVPAGPYTYTGLAQTPAMVIVTGAGGLNETSTATYLNNINAGTATASYTYTESANHFASSDSENFVIDKAASVTIVTVPAGPYTYTGLAQTPATVSVTGAGGLNETPTADYVNNTNAGTATASYTYAESANHFGSSDSEDFIIGKAESVTVVTVLAGPYTYTGSAQTPATVSVTGAGGLNETPAASYTNNVNAGTANASYTYVETANYFGSSDNKNFTIGKKGLIITADHKSKYEGQVNPTFSVTYNGFVNGEDEEDLGGTLVLTTAATVNSCANDYDIVPSGLISGNYAITFVKGTLTVNGVTIDASASSTPVAIGTAATLRATVSPAVAGVSVTFYLDNLVKGTSLTDGTGKAILVVNGLAADVYEIKAMIGSGCSASEVVFLPVYDPAGGFVTGGGWIDSPAGAMTGLKENVVGKANFGFNAKYKTGKNNTTEVDGNTNFQFKAGDLHFSSAIHDNMQLVISGAKATYTGTGTVNGVGNHKFRVIAIDGEVSGGDGTDKFRIMIWENNSSSTLLYDNKRGDSESGDDATTLGGGSIVIHKPKGNSKAQEDITKGTPIIMEDLRPEILETLAASPNPVVSTSTVRFSVTEDANVILRVYDYSGRLIETLYNGSVKAFENKDVDFDRKNLMSGIYIVKLTTQNGQSYEKRIIVK